MTEVNQERVRLLIDAARSGKYTKCKGGLNNSLIPNSFCFLGLMCEVSGLGKWGTEDRDGWYLIDTLDPNSNYLAKDSSYKYLPDTVKDWYGLEDCNPKIKATDPLNEEVKEVSLATLNDVWGFSLTEIADLLEQEYCYES